MLFRSENPNIEIRYILDALKNDLFINQLESNFVELFFVFVYYILNEQKYVDWVFKTSFIKVLHKIKQLNQPPVYIKDNQEYYKSYIEEVKPYHTTIREYVVNYEGVDNSNNYITDFDVPGTFDSVLGVYRSPSGEFLHDEQLLAGQNYFDWLSNYTYNVSEIIIEDGGTGYTVPPQILITEIGRAHV